jgi:uncharacterized membrane protein
MLVLLFLHLVLVISGISLIFGSFAVALFAERSGQLTAIAAVAALHIDRLIPPLMVGGGIFGLETAYSFGYSLTKAWLVIAYLLFGVAAIWGVAVSGPTFQKLADRARGGGSTPGADLPALLRRLHVDALVSFGLVFLLIGDRVFKPFR